MRLVAGGYYTLPQHSTENSLNRQSEVSLGHARVESFLHYIQCCISFVKTLWSKA